MKPEVGLSWEAQATDASVTLVQSLFFLPVPSGGKLSFTCLGAHSAPTNSVIRTH